MPYLTGTAFLFIVIFHKRGCHIHAESITSVRKPEAHYILDSFPCSHCGGVTKALLPWFGDLVEAIIESWLTLKEVQDIAGASLTLSAYIWEPVSALKTEISPDKTIGILILLRLLTLKEPGVLFRCVTRYKVQQYTDAFFMSLFKEVVKILVSTIPRCNSFVVPDIISGIFERRVITRIDPEGIASETPDIVQFLDYPIYIANTITIRIFERLRVYFIENCIL